MEAAHHELQDEIETSSLQQLNSDLPAHQFPN